MAELLISSRKTSQDDLRSLMDCLSVAIPEATAFLAPIETLPSKRDCERVLSDRRDPSEVIPNLSTRWVCVSTSEGHVAFVKIIRLPGVGSAQLTLEYVVWQ